MRQQVIYSALVMAVAPVAVMAATGTYQTTAVQQIPAENASVQLLNVTAIDGIGDYKMKIVSSAPAHVDIVLYVPNRINVPIHADLSVGETEIPFTALNNDQLLSLLNETPFTISIINNSGSSFTISSVVVQPKDYNAIKNKLEQEGVTATISSYQTAVADYTISDENVAKLTLLRDICEGKLNQYTVANFEKFNLYAGVEDFENYFTNELKPAIEIDQLKLDMETLKQETEDMKEALDADPEASEEAKAAVQKYEDEVNKLEDLKQQYIDNPTEDNLQEVKNQQTYVGELKEYTDYQLTADKVRQYIGKYENLLDEYEASIPGTENYDQTTAYVEKNRVGGAKLGSYQVNAFRTSGARLAGIKMAYDMFVEQGQAAWEAYENTEVTEFVAPTNIQASISKANKYETIAKLLGKSDEVKKADKSIGVMENVGYIQYCAQRYQEGFENVYNKIDKTNQQYIYKLTELEQKVAEMQAKDPKCDYSLLLEQLKTEFYNKAQLGVNKIEEELKDAKKNGGEISYAKNGNWTTNPEGTWINELEALQLEDINGFATTLASVVEGTRDKFDADLKKVTGTEDPENQLLAYLNKVESEIVPPSVKEEFHYDEDIAKIKDKINALVDDVKDANEALSTYRTVTFTPTNAAVVIKDQNDIVVKEIPQGEEPVTVQLPVLPVGEEFTFEGINVEDFESVEVVTRATIMTEAFDEVLQEKIDEIYDDILVLDNNTSNTRGEYLAWTAVKNDVAGEENSLQTRYDNAKTALDALTENLNTLRLDDEAEKIYQDSEFLKDIKTRVENYIKGVTDTINRVYGLDTDKEGRRVNIPDEDGDFYGNAQAFMYNSSPISIFDVPTNTTEGWADDRGTASVIEGTNTLQVTPGSSLDLVAKRFNNLPTLKEGMTYFFHVTFGYPNNTSNLDDQNKFIVRLRTNSDVKATVAKAAAGEAVLKYTVPAGGGDLDNCYLLVWRNGQSGFTVSNIYITEGDEESWHNTPIFVTKDQDVQIPTNTLEGWTIITPVQEGDVAVEDQTIKLSKRVSMGYGLGKLEAGKTYRLTFDADLTGGANWALWDGGLNKAIKNKEDKNIDNGNYPLVPNARNVFVFTPKADVENATFLINVKGTISNISLIGGETQTRNTIVGEIEKIEGAKAAVENYIASRQAYDADVKTLGKIKEAVTGSGIATKYTGIIDDAEAQLKTWKDSIAKAETVAAEFSLADEKYENNDEAHWNLLASLPTAPIQVEDGEDSYTLDEYLDQIAAEKALYEFNAFEAQVMQLYTSIYGTDGDASQNKDGLVDQALDKFNAAKAESYTALLGDKTADKVFGKKAGAIIDLWNGLEENIRNTALKDGSKGAKKFVDEYTQDKANANELSEKLVLLNTLNDHLHGMKDTLDAAMKERPEAGFAAGDHVNTVVISNATNIDSLVMYTQAVADSVADNDHLYDSLTHVMTGVLPVMKAEIEAAMDRYITENIKQDQARLTYFTEQYQKLISQFYDANKLDEELYVGKIEKAHTDETLRSVWEMKLRDQLEEYKNDTTVLNASARFTDQWLQVKADLIAALDALENEQDTYGDISKCKVFKDTLEKLGTEVYNLLVEGETVNIGIKSLDPESDELFDLASDYDEDEFNEAYDDRTYRLELLKERIKKALTDSETNKDAYDGILKEKAALQNRAEYILNELKDTEQYEPTDEGNALIDIITNYYKPIGSKNAARIEELYAKGQADLEGPNSTRKDDVEPYEADPTWAEGSLTIEAPDQLVYHVLRDSLLHMNALYEAFQADYNDVEDGSLAKKNNQIFNEQIVGAYDRVMRIYDKAVLALNQFKTPKNEYLKAAFEAAFEAATLEIYKAPKDLRDARAAADDAKELATTGNDEQPRTTYDPKDDVSRIAEIENRVITSFNVFVKTMNDAAQNKWANVKDDYQAIVDEAYNTINKNNDQYYKDANRTKMADDTKEVLFQTELAVIENADGYSNLDLVENPDELTTGNFDEFLKFDALLQPSQDAALTLQGIEASVAEKMNEYAHTDITSRITIKRTEAVNKDRETLQGNIPATDANGNEYSYQQALGTEAYQLLMDEFNELVKTTVDAADKLNNQYFEAGQLPKAVIDENTVNTRAEVLKLMRDYTAAKFQEILAKAENGFVVVDPETGDETDYDGWRTYLDDADYLIGLKAFEDRFAKDSTGITSLYVGSQSYFVEELKKLSDALHAEKAKKGSSEMTPADLTDKLDELIKKAKEDDYTAMQAELSVLKEEYNNMVAQAGQAITKAENEETPDAEKIAQLKAERDALVNMFANSDNEELNIDENVDKLDDYKDALVDPDVEDATYADYVNVEHNVSRIKTEIAILRGELSADDIAAMGTNLLNRIDALLNMQSQYQDYKILEPANEKAEGYLYDDFGLWTNFSDANWKEYQSDVETIKRLLNATKSAVESHVDANDILLFVNNLSGQIAKFEENGSDDLKKGDLEFNSNIADDDYASKFEYNQHDLVIAASQRKQYERLKGDYDAVAAQLELAKLEVANLGLVDEEGNPQQGDFTAAEEELAKILVRLNTYYLQNSSNPLTDNTTLATSKPEKVYRIAKFETAPDLVTEEWIEQWGLTEVYNPENGEVSLPATKGLNAVTKAINKEVLKHVKDFTLKKWGEAEDAYNQAADILDATQMRANDKDALRYKLYGALSDVKDETVKDGEGNIVKEDNSFQKQLNDLYNERNSYTVSNLQEYVQKVQAFIEALLGKMNDAGEIEGGFVNEDVNTTKAGDLQGDGLIDMLDLTKLMNLVKDPKKQNLDENGNYDPSLAPCDLNDDGYIDVVDLGIMVDIINGDTDYLYDEGVFSSRAARMNESVSASVVSAKGNMHRIAVSLNNTRDYTAFQMDVVLPEGLHIVGAELSNRAAEQTLYTNEWDGNKTRILAFTAGKAAISGNEGELLYIDVESDENYNGGSVNYDNILFVTTKSQGVRFQMNGETTGIMDRIASAADAAKQTIYNMGGRVMNGLKKGINIIRGNNGDTEKVIRK